MHRSSNNESLKDKIQERYMFFIKHYKDITGIALEDVKFNPIVDEKYCDFNEFYKDISKVGEGAFSSVLKGLFRKNDKVPLAIKIVSYKESFINFETKILEALFTLVEGRHTPHITIPLFYYSCSKEHVGSFRQYIDDYRYNHNDRFGVIAMERVYSTFLDISRKLDYNERCIIFVQIVLVMVCIHYYFPKFKHNDLHQGNFLIRKSISEGYTYYNYKGYQFYLPNIGYQILISDFGMSTLDIDRKHDANSDDNKNILHMYNNLLEKNSKGIDITNILFSPDFQEYTVPKKNVVLTFTL